MELIIPMCVDLGELDAKNDEDGLDYTVEIHPKFIINIETVKAQSRIRILNNKN